MASGSDELDKGAVRRRPEVWLPARTVQRRRSQVEEDDEELQKGNTKAVVILFVAYFILLILLFRSFPKLAPDEYAQLQFPRSVRDVRALSKLMLKYRDDNYVAVVAGFCGVYIFLQTFAIPGAVFLSILAGPLFGVVRGLALVSLVATVGSAMCYLLSFYLAHGLVHRCFPRLLDRFRLMVHEHRHNLLFYMLFLRLSPLMPNWFINVAAPLLNVPLPYFVSATAIGLIPLNYIHVTTGLTLNELQSVGVSPLGILTLFGLALLALVPTFFRRKFEKLDAVLADKAE